MSVKIKEEKFSRAESFLVRLATVMSGPSSVARSRDIETSAKRVADLLSARVAEGDLDSVLSVIDRTLGRETEPVRREAPPRVSRLAPRDLTFRARDTERTRVQEIDPYFWG